jgi:hypothetical protein
MVFKSKPNLFYFTLGLKNFVRKIMLDFLFINPILFNSIIYLKVVNKCFENFTYQIRLLYLLDFLTCKSININNFKIVKQILTMNY